MEADLGLDELLRLFHDKAPRRNWNQNLFANSLILVMKSRSLRQEFSPNTE